MEIDKFKWSRVGAKAALALAMEHAAPVWAWEGKGSARWEMLHLSFGSPELDAWLQIGMCSVLAALALLGLYGALALWRSKRSKASRP